MAVVALDYKPKTPQIERRSRATAGAAFLIGRALAFVIIALLGCTIEASAGQRPGRDLFPDIAVMRPDSFATIENEARSLPFARGKLFKVTSPSGSESYLFGTLHLADPRVTSFSSLVRKALSASEIMIMETSEIGASLDRRKPRLRGALEAKRDRQPDKLLAAEEFARFEGAFGQCQLDGVPAKKLKATAIALAFDRKVDKQDCAKKSSAPYADSVLASLAQAQNIPVVGLESLAEQLEIGDGLPRDADRDLLISTLRRSPYAVDIEETEIQRYLKSDTGELLAWMRSPDAVPGLVGAQTPTRFLDRLVTKRNHRMCARALPFLETKRVFMAIGAAHLPGPEGVAQLLANKGFLIQALE